MFNWLPVLQNTQLYLSIEHKSNKFSEVMGLEKLYFWFIIDFTENVLYTENSHFHVQMQEVRVQSSDLKTHI